MWEKRIGQKEVQRSSAIARAEKEGEKGRKRGEKKGEKGKGQTGNKGAQKAVFQLHQRKISYSSTHRTNRLGFLRPAGYALLALFMA